MKKTSKKVISPLLFISISILLGTSQSAFPKIPAQPISSKIMTSVHAVNPSAIPKVAPKEVPKEILGKVISLKGKAWAARAPKIEDKIELKNGDPIQDNDVLTTSKDAELKVVLNEKEAAFLVKNQGLFQIRKSPEKAIIIDLNEGQILSHIKKTETNIKNRFQVRSRGAVMGVRGTTFFVKAEKDKNLFLCTCEGLVSVDNKVLIFSKHHDSPREILNGNAPLGARLKNAPMGADHSDTEGSDLAKALE